MNALLLQAEPEVFGASADSKVAILGGRPGLAAVPVPGGDRGSRLPSATVRFHRDRVNQSGGARKLAAGDLVSLCTLAKPPCCCVVAADPRRHANWSHLKTTRDVPRGFFEDNLDLLLADPG